MQSWDYATEGAYFITICTKDRVEYFGEIVHGEMQLNELGCFAQNVWMEIPAQFPFIELGTFVIMPNHTHGILMINHANDCTATVETRLIASLPTVQTEINGGFANKKNPMFHNNISRVIRWYKGRCTFEMHKIDVDFAWQPSFHDHIIRNSFSYENIQNYIISNPQKWADDMFNSLKNPDSDK